jgi:hypothetical protein
VGMNRWLALVSCSCVGVPHARGDDPVELTNDNTRLLRSPGETQVEAATGVLHIVDCSFGAIVSACLAAEARDADDRLAKVLMREFTAMAALNYMTPVRRHSDRNVHP